jgi:hypothetical protein
MPLYFNQAPLFQVASGLPFGGGGGGAQGTGPNRASGRGTTSDPDITQGMPQASPVPSRSPAARGGGNSNDNGEESLTDEQRQAVGAFYTPPAMRPRVIVRFVAEERNLLVSGMLAGGSELSNRPAVVDVPVGRGHVILFATNPMWRHQSQGAFFMLFNAALHFDNLGVGAGLASPASARPSPRPSDEDDNNN